MTLYKWSQIPGTNATADATINWAEGQAPSSINDSARGMMAALAKYRDDAAGAIVTSGTSTSYTVSSYEGFDSLAHLGGQMIAFTPHVTNGATVTLNVDSLGARPLRSAPNSELQSGVLIQGTPYVATYNNSDGAFYLHGFYGNPYSVPLGGMLDFVGTTAPNSSFVLPFGQPISRTTYAPLFNLIGTTYGTGDGSNTFNVPDLRGRIAAGADNMGGTAASRLTISYFGANAGVLGAVGGGESHVLSTGEMPMHTHGVSDPGHAHAVGTILVQGAGGNTLGASAGAGFVGLTSQSAVTGVSIQSTGGGSPHAIVQPTIIVNKILRVL